MTETNKNNLSNTAAGIPTTPWHASQTVKERLHDIDVAHDNYIELITSNIDDILKMYCRDSLAVNATEHENLAQIYSNLKSYFEIGYGLDVEQFCTKIQFKKFLTTMGFNIAGGIIYGLRFMTNEDSKLLRNNM